MGLGCPHGYHLFLYFSPRWKQMLGYADDEITPRGEEWSMRLHPDDRERALHAVRLHINGAPDVFELVHRLRHKDGTYRWMLARAAAQRDAGGQLQRIVGTLTDITDRKGIEHQLRESEQRYRSLFDHHPDAVYAFDLAGHFVSANPGCERVSGYTVEELLGMSWMPLVLAEELEQSVAHFRRAAQGEPQRYQSAIRHKDGHRVEIDVTNLPILVDGQVVGVYGIARDVTAQHRAAAQLREQEEHYRSVFASTSDGLAITDVTGTLVAVNPAFCQMYGYTAADLVGQNAALVIQPEQHDVLTAVLERVTAGCAVERHMAARRPDGSSFPIAVRGQSLQFQGAPHILLVTRDITEQVQAYELLEQRVAERTGELTTLLEVARDMASTLELESLLAQILAQLRRVVDYTAATVRVPQGEQFIAVAYEGPAPCKQMVRWPGMVTLSREVLRTRSSLIIDDLQDAIVPSGAVQEEASAPSATTDRRAWAWLGVPLLLKDRVLGVLSLIHAEPGYYTDRHAELVMAVASHIAVALENARLYQQVQEAAVSEERARIAREMHDSLAQMLFYVNTQAEAVRTLLRSGQTEQAAEQLEQLAQAARDAYADVREDILALRTAGLSRGLVESLRAYLPLWQEQSGVQVDLVIAPTDAPLPSLSPAVEMQVVRIVQHALANVRQHAQAHQVQIRLSAETEQLSVVIEDDGVGFDPALRERSASPHFGLAMMRERAVAAGIQLEIISRPGRGTRVVMRVPVEATPAGAVRGD